MTKNNEYQRIDEYLKYRLSKDEQAKIQVESNIQGERISERLFGLFTEHLGKNVYGGAWAQVFANGGFEDFNKSLTGVPEHQQPDLKEKTKARLELAGKQFGNPELARYEEIGLAPYWGPVNNDGKYSLTTGFNGTAQKVEIGGKETVGLETPIFLPLHRINTYDLKIQVLLPEDSLEHPPHLHFQICQIQGKENSDLTQQDDYRLSPYGLDYGGTVDTDSNIKVLCEEEVKLLPVVTPGKWSRVRTVFNVDHHDVPAGARLKFRIIIDRPGTVLFDQAQLFPTDAIEGWDPEVVDYLRQLQVSVLRFPGGNFVSGYNWQDGIGPVEERPEKPNPAWPEWEPNQVGTDEWLTLCELIGAEPLICVNAGNGNPREAANWVRYCNAPVTDKWGKMRAQNGHPEPYNVRLWEIGNELWGKFQINWATSDEYGKRFTEFAEKMKEVDPTINLMAVGGTMPDVVKKENKRKEMLGAEYARPALENNPDQIWALAEHAVMGGGIAEEETAKSTYLELIAQTHHVGEILNKDFKCLQGLDSKALIVQTEQMVAVSGEDRPADDALAAAIVWSGFINWFIRSGGRVPLFTRSAMINHGDLLKKVRGVTYPLPGYWGQLLYANQPGRLPVSINLETPLMNAGGSYFEQSENMPVIDSVGLLNEEKDQLVVLATNRDPERTISTEICLIGFDTEHTARMKLLGGTSYSDRNYWYKADHVSPVSRDINVDGNKCKIELPATSIVVITFSEKRVN